MVAMQEGAGVYDGGMYPGNSAADAQAAAAQRHFTLNRHKPGMQQQQQQQHQAPVSHTSGRVGSAAQMQHVSYSKNPQPQPPQGYSPHRAYADPRGVPQPHYPQGHPNGADRAEHMWQNGSRHQSTYPSRRPSPGPHDGF
ncbi:hypothetical protein GGI21_006461 [Coemansia aciculifera]|nr:hypothetical protein GGI21_006461 [Coemansia aciculifera]